MVHLPWWQSVAEWESRSSYSFFFAAAVIRLRNSPGVGLALKLPLPRPCLVVWAGKRLDRVASAVRWAVALAEDHLTCHAEVFLALAS